ncbi:3-hydroxyacyl-CoA dehydrogenase family protein [Dyadobacter sandarakinus]|uniref:3-hydroxyacyl-CoA dehydrogenase family protein n=1 Tax=Dyadobacter sandarakinus TaxID=2747268 RepID=A0ABX7I552_9BACT|nr:3-hydroxyacyl-CoA dehydrogenase family protein [Dyadobacter sandarakinus]QRR01224.1 3-hydroxyacyl-CoA dehydrogenase family protein [Dyadobacter sandarakinus]
MNTNEIPVGIVGLGLMGCSIVTCLLIAGHPVVAIAPISADMGTAGNRIREHLQTARDKGLIGFDPEHYLQNLVISEDYGQLRPCRIVNECTIENVDIKASVYKKIEDVIAPDAILSSNTSAIPISTLQNLTRHPERFLGLHWTEPAHTTRFLEIICGDASDVQYGEYLYKLSHLWQKEPILVRKDIAGFITNRLMYAMYREAINLVENGYATIEDVDRSCRNNAGYFMTFVGIFRWMDLTGVPAYHTVMKNLLPTLFNGQEVPELIDKVVREGGKGVLNGHGFYEYEPGEPEMWEETFKEFTYDVRQLALKYPGDLVKRKLHGKEGNEG